MLENISLPIPFPRTGEISSFKAETLQRLGDFFSRALEDIDQHLADYRRIVKVADLDRFTTRSKRNSPLVFTAYTLALRAPFAVGDRAVRAVQKLNL